MSVRLSTGELIDRIIVVYASLRKPHTKKAGGYISDSIAFLSRLKGQLPLNATNISTEDISHLYRLILDASGIISVSKGNFDSFTMGDLSALGPKKDVLGVFDGDNQQIYDWMSATLFQASSPVISADLRFKLKGKGEVCDYIVGQTLIECKRIHPSGFHGPFSDIVPKVMMKIDNTLYEAKKQLDNTKNILKIPDPFTLVVLDISPYGDKNYWDSDGQKIIGLRPNSGINSMIVELEKHPIIGIDEIDLCWSNCYCFEGSPRAISYYTQPILWSKDKRSNVKYMGWTIEFYPSGKQSSGFQELRISSTARSHAWIKASWFSCTDNLISWGPEETLS